jgi:hypothetical protein
VNDSVNSLLDYPLPPVRRLRVYAFDPQASVELSTAVINDAVIELPWESRWETPLAVGPVNDYLEVIDYDPASGVFYAPVDLNHPTLLAQNGLPPSEGRPQFHQQMVFAVAMRTIRAFERALGRVVIWAGDRSQQARIDKLDPIDRAFTRKLRIYPHALREVNAYYSPEKRALLFGYFQTNTKAKDIDASWVFTCLSQDIVAHETTHAILHGLQQRSIEPCNVDALAFHEGFADIVALLQHFSLSEVLRHQLAQSRGSLRENGLLTGLAQQFGRATGRHGALRYALGLLQDEKPLTAAPNVADPNGAGKDSKKDEPPTLATTTEAHARGGFLVAAVFDAFVTIYERRTADLFRLGSTPKDGGVLSELSPVLVARLASEASKAADHVLRMCVRALDYIPPVDLMFGEYLRAIITADTDLVPNDQLRYRVAFVQSFRKWGISVPGCISMAPDSLLWSPPELSDYPTFAAMKGGGSDAISAMFADLLKRLQLSVAFDGTAENHVGFDSRDFERSSVEGTSEEPSRNLRDLAMRIIMYNQLVIHEWFDADSPGDEDWEHLLGMRLLPPEHMYRKATIAPMASITTKFDPKTKQSTGTPLFEVHSARIARRAGPNGEELHQLIIQMTQRRRAYFDLKEQEAADVGRIDDIGDIRWKSPDFWFRGGATIHVDLRDGRLLRIIRKRIDNNDRLITERAFRTGDSSGVGMAVGDAAEPFAFMHRSGE